MSLRQSKEERREERRIRREEREQERKRQQEERQKKEAEKKQEREKQEKEKLEKKGEKRKDWREGETLHRMTSITRQIHWYWLRKKIIAYLVFDLCLAGTGLLSFLVAYEYATFGVIDLKAGRSFETPLLKGWRDTVYRVEGEEGTLLELPLYPILRILLILLIILACIQLLGAFYTYVEEDHKIRRILGPLNELALKADKLSRISFSEDKYQQIEDAISHLEPVDSDASLSFGDSDLAGIEAAMNNLLRRMRDVYRQQSRFVNDASHELRTPIAVIQGYANLLDRWGKTDEKILTESIEAIKNESEHMNHLVEQLLFLARGDSGRLHFNKERISLSSLVEEVYEESLLIDERHRYKLARGEEASIEVDVGLIKQATRILVDNAAKYTKEGGQICLSYGTEGTEDVFIAVQDTGCGMSEEDVEHMFERFYRSDEVRSYEGTGLGLSIAKWIVDRHRGKFEVLSRSRLGTRIRIILPRETPASRAA